MGTYATLADVRAEGVTVAEADDAKVNKLLAWATTYIDQVTGQFFEKRTLSPLRLDGPHPSTDVLELPFPVITLTGLTINDAVQSLADFVVYNRFLPDDRDDPRVIAKNGSAAFTPGDLNVELTGDFGYTTPDNLVAPTLFAVPEDIRTTCIRLVLRGVPLLTDESAQQTLIGGFIRQEVTDRHSISYDKSMIVGEGAVGLTGDRNIDEVLIRYRSPRMYVYYESPVAIGEVGR